MKFRQNMRRLAARLTTTSTSADIDSNFLAKVQYNPKEPYCTQQKATRQRTRYLGAFNKLLQVNN